MEIPEFVDGGEPSCLAVLSSTRSSAFGYKNMLSEWDLASRMSDRTVKDPPGPAAHPPSRAVPSKGEELERREWTAIVDGREKPGRSCSPMADRDGACDSSVQRITTPGGTHHVAPHASSGERSRPSSALV